jgi:hypothetical protein
MTVDGKKNVRDFKTTAPAVNEYCLTVPLFQNAGSVLSLGFVMPEGKCKSSINAWQELIDPHETRHVSTCPYRTGWLGVASDLKRRTRDTAPPSER